MKTADSLIKDELALLIEDTKRISEELGEEVDHLLEEGNANPLSYEQARRLLTKVIHSLKVSAQAKGQATPKGLDQGVDAIVKRILLTRDRLHGVQNGSSPAPVNSGPTLVDWKGMKVDHVQPTPWFQGRAVPMIAGFVKTTELKLWDQNERLDIHLGQFRQKHGREPNPSELIDIMMSSLKLPGLTEEDQFEIKELARSIAINGVRKPPILDTDGTLLDGNRRVTACRYILSSDEFDQDAKKMAERIYVWQLTPSAAEDDRRAVVVSLNFESDCKQDWPEYVKARKVYEEWQAMLALEPRSPSAPRQAILKRQISIRFALGPETNVVNRYLKMVRWANEFEDHHVATRKRDEYEVMHKANHYFQYFDELAKGEGNGVANTLKDDTFRGLVFDLLYENKFDSWKSIRDLKYIYPNEEARQLLLKAKAESDTDEAINLVEQAGAIATTQKAEIRQLGANTRIETFVKWLEELPVKAFRDQITSENLQRLLKALQLVENQVKSVQESE